ncbi:MAG: MipA/OmpV family protein [Alphaproteobacteria bacterium]|nr:MipA/OmpV family protein [Alphaproteobacteria bacterium]
MSYVTWRTAHGCVGSAAALLIVLSPACVSAVEWDLSLGAGVGIAPDYEGSDEYEAVPVLSARLDYGERFLELRNTALRANILANGIIHAGPVINYRFERDDVDEDAVDDLDDVDDAIELGGFVGFSYQGWLGSITATQDVSDGHDGYLIALKAGYRAKVLPSLAVTTIASGTYADDDYMDTYFGIDAGDAAASGLDEFDADEGFKDVGLTLNIDYEYGAGWGVTGIVAYTRLLDDAEDSPVVDDVGDENQLFGGVALTYSF